MWQIVNPASDCGRLSKFLRLYISLIITIKDIQSRYVYDIQWLQSEQNHITNSYNSPRTVLITEATIQRRSGPASQWGHLTIFLQSTIICHDIQRSKSSPVPEYGCIANFLQFLITRTCIRFSDFLTLYLIEFVSQNYCCYPQL